MAFQVGKGGSVRAFLIEGGARPDHEPKYMDCWMVGAADHSLGDVERIECPSPDSYNQWIEVGEFQGAEDRPSTSVSGRFPLDKESDMRRIAQARCRFGLQAHLGTCTDPTNFNDCQKAVIFEEGLFTNYATEDLGALGSGDQSEIGESSDLSSKEFYEALPITVAERGGDAVVNPVVDVVICDNPSCGDCEAESDGCQDIYAVDDGVAGSPGTPPDVIYSTDKGANWAAEDVNSLENGEAADGIACVDEYVVVISNTSNSLHYKERALIGDGVTNWTEQDTGFAGAGGEPNDIWSVGTYAFIVGDGGYVYGTSDPTAGVTVLDAGIATQDTLNAVHAISDEFVVAVGANSAVIYSNNGVTFQEAAAEPGDGSSNLQAIWIVDEDQWWAGGDVDGNGEVLWYTLDGGVTWTAKDLPGTDWTTVYDIAFASKAVGRIVADKSGTPAGFILETWDGGYSWVNLHRGTGAGAIPAQELLIALAVCEHDVNFVTAVGTATGGADGIILVGQD